MEVERKVSSKELKKLLNEHINASADETISLDKLRKQMCGVQVTKSIGTAPDEDEDDLAFNPDRMTEKDLRALIDARANAKKADLVEEFMGGFTLHGYPPFYYTTGFRKFLWFAVLVTMFTLIFRLAQLSYDPANVYKQIIQVEVEKVQQINFPTLTICTYSPLHAYDAWKKFPGNISKEEFHDFYYQVLSNRDIANRPKVDKKLMNRVLDMLSKQGYTSYSDVLKLFEKNSERDINSPIVKRFMRQNTCLYENKPCNFDRDFKVVYRHNFQSICLQFNSFKKGTEGLMSTGNDLGNGFFMSWDISGTHYHDDSGLHGLLIEIHAYGTPHHLVDQRNVIFLEPGARTNIDILEVETKRLPPPFYPNCGEEKLEVIKDFPYSQATCNVDCYLEIMLEECGCVADQFADFVDPKIRICKVNEMGCAFAASQETHCHACAVKCIEETYEMKYTRLGFGNDKMLKTLLNVSGFEDKTPQEIFDHAKQNIVSFRIGFKSLDKQVKKYVQSMPWFERISLLGGTVGLLLGLSLTTMFEVIFVAVDYAVATVKYKLTHSYLTDVLKRKTV